MAIRNLITIHVLGKQQVHSYYKIDKDAYVFSQSFFFTFFSSCPSFRGQINFVETLDLYTLITSDLVKDVEDRNVIFIYISLAIKLKFTVNWVKKREHAYPRYW